MKVKQKKSKHFDSDPPILTREGYYTIPPMEKLQKMTNSQLSQIKDFTVGHVKFGKVTWIGETDVRGLNLDKLVSFNPRSVEVYDDSSNLDKPDEGTGLNKPAIIELYDVWPSCPKNYAGDRTTYDPKSDHKALQQYVNKLMKYCSKKEGVEFREYDVTNGKWIFSVKHFSIYGIDNDDFDNYVATQKKAF